MKDLGVILGIAGLDYCLKSYMEKNRKQGEQQEILGGKLILRNCHNKDSAFRILKKLYQGENSPGTTLSAMILGGVIWEFFKLGSSGQNPLARTGTAMILGGGISNFYDRKKKGYVVDYVSFGVKNKKFRNIVFNISDFCIFIGTGLYLLSGLKEKK